MGGPNKVGCPPTHLDKLSRRTDSPPGRVNALFGRPQPFVGPTAACVSVELEGGAKGSLEKKVLAVRVARAPAAAAYTRYKIKKWVRQHTRDSAQGRRTALTTANLETDHPSKRKAGAGWATEPATLARPRCLAIGQSRRDHSQPLSPISPSCQACRQGGGAVQAALPLELCSS